MKTKQILVDFQRFYDTMEEDIEYDIMCIDTMEKIVDVIKQAKIKMNGLTQINQVDIHNDGSSHRMKIPNGRVR